MSRKMWWQASCAGVALAMMMQPVMAVAAEDAATVKLAPKSSDLVISYAKDVATEPSLTHAEKLALLKKKVKYVFVLFQENRSFDQHFGTFPGAFGLFSKPKSQTAGFVQPIVNTDGTIGTISPFLIPRTIQDVHGNTVPLYPEDTASVDHSHTGMVNSMHVLATKQALNDRYVIDQEGFTTNASGQIVTKGTGLPVSAATAPSLAQKQAGELMVSHLDCDTVPFLWQYADRFTLFDNFHQTVIGPSTPNAIAMIAGQSGLTQVALHPGTASNNTASSAVSTSGGEPMVGDPAPFAGSTLDFSPVKPPQGPNDENPAKPALTQTYASLPLSFMGSDIEKTIQSDENPALDLLDVQEDIRTIAGEGVKPINWGWYQQGYDHEPTDGTGPATYGNYITHHNGPQYFGYVGDNTVEQTHLHGLGDFYSDIAAKKLAPQGGVYYVRGGYGTNDGLTPLDPNPAVKATFAGNDDHPGYSDAQLSEALVAEEVNAIAASPYWKDSAIIITYDETDGLYDHAQPQIRARDPEGNPLEGGPRIPAIVVSPYSRVHVIDSEYSEHSSVIKFINELYGLTPLENLPDEVKGRALGLKEFGQPNYAPADAEASIGDLFGAFDNGRLSGDTLPLPASYAMIPSSAVLSLPHYGGQGCYVLNIVPTDYVGGKLIDPPPADFNPRPGTTPGIPTSGTWTP